MLVLLDEQPQLEREVAKEKMEQQGKGLEMEGFPKSYAHQLAEPF